MVLRALLLSLSLLLPVRAALAAPDIGAIVDGHVLPGFETLAEASDKLAVVAGEHCDAADPALREAYATAFDAWVRVSHLRFGPTERGDRAFALAFWPDSRGATPKALASLIASGDPVVGSEAAFATVSVAARGFHALEFLLYDGGIRETGADAYRCALVQAIARDIAAIAGAILADWRDDYAWTMKTAGGNDTYRTREEAAQELFKAVSTGLQFTSDTRLGRPLGTFDRPRPQRAEAWRSGRSLRHVVLSLEGTRDLALRLAADAPEVADSLDAAYAHALELAARLDDPVFAGVADPQGRLRVEVLQQAIDQVRRVVAAELGPGLGVAAGFNALDGD